MKPLTEGMEDTLRKCIDLVSDEQHSFESDHAAFYVLNNVVFHLLKARHAIEKHNDIRRQS